MRILLFAFALLGGLASTLKADIVQYGNFTGATVFFNNVTESSSSIPSVGNDLYGAPETPIMGNMLRFSPLNFEAGQTGPGIKRVDGQLNVNIQAKSGVKISGVLVEEFGDFSITVPFAGSQGGYVSVGLQAFGETVTGIVQDSDSFVQTTPSPPNMTIKPWSLTAGLDSFGLVDEIRLRIDNQLSAASSTQFDDSFIKKKGFKITVTTVSVPEPTSLMLILACGLAFVPMTRRR